MGVAVALTLAIHQRPTLNYLLKASTHDMLSLEEIAHLRYLRACPAEGVSRQDGRIGSHRHVKSAQGVTHAYKLRHDLD